mgnify:CR=1 FL=1
MAEKEIEPKEILRRTRIEVMPYLREVAEHRRAIVPRMEIASRWVKYYEDISKIRPLTAWERSRFVEHRRLKEFLSARREVFSAAGRYARTKTAPDLVALRLAQAHYYRAKAETLPPEQRKEMLEKLVPAKEIYTELVETQVDLRAKCKTYKMVEHRRGPYVLVTPAERAMTLKGIGEALRADYVKIHELGQTGKDMGELIEHYRTMKELGAK